MITFVVRSKQNILSTLQLQMLKYSKFQNQSATIQVDISITETEEDTRPLSLTPA